VSLSPTFGSHPTFVRYKASYPRCFTASYLGSKPTVVKIGPSLCRSQIGTYHVVIRAIVVTVGFAIIHHIYSVLFLSYSPLKSHKKKSYSHLLVLLLCVLSVHRVASHHRYSSAVLLFIFFSAPLICYLVFAEKELKKKLQKKRVKKKGEKEKRSERGCVADCVASSFISESSSLWYTIQQH
jgi:hypothetical protein